MLYTDQLGDQINIQSSGRIICLVPSITELLFALGLDERIVGVTKFCIHPESARKDKTIIGGTKNFRLEVIRELQPDLIVGNKEENYIEGIETLKRDFPVWMSDIITLNDAKEMIRELGKITDTRENADHIIHKIESEFQPIRNKVPGTKVLYFIWQNPYMVAGKDTFINSILEWTGFSNLGVNFEGRYPEISTQELQNLDPDLVFLSSEPYPFKQKQVKELQPLFKKTRIEIVNGEMFSWYGSRLIKAGDYLKKLMGELV